MRRVLDQVMRAARTQTHVLISGEPGTGRELVAREIHRRTETADGPFVRVACTAASPEDFEFDLFGHLNQVTGRPDRRSAERIGRAGHLFQAIGGTVFLTNLTDIAMPVQARLARLLRQNEAVVLNAKNKVNLSMRVIAAVEQGYDQQARDVRIQQDLFELLAETRIDLPPLRRRAEDIPGLASFLLSETCKQNGLASKELSSAAQQLLCALPWHGNATELQRLLTELVNRVHGDLIDLTDVLATVQIDGRAKPFARGGTLREARAIRARVHCSGRGAASRPHSGSGKDARRAAAESLSQAAPSECADDVEAKRSLVPEGYKPHSAQEIHKNGGCVD
jgi:DNA-binding NtrC family response regulator